MKTCVKKLFLLPALLAGLGSILAGRVVAQSFTTLHSFLHNATGRPAGSVNGGLILSGNTLYGSTYFGGDSDDGTVFAVSTDGTAFTTLYSFTMGSGGRHPEDGLILSDNTLYGTANIGGSSGNGTVFKLNSNGTGFTTLHSFTATDPITLTNSDGSLPIAALIFSNNTLFGTAASGGSSDDPSGVGAGTVFAVNTNGTGFRTLHSFTFADGDHPEAGLILSGNALYGTTAAGGSWDDGTGLAGGTVFTVNTDGTGFTSLHEFAGGDGAGSSGALSLSGTTLYGTSPGGGSSGNGAVFALNTDGTSFTVLYNFTATAGTLVTNSDGAQPSGVILSGNTLYGTAYAGGPSGIGTVFAINTDGTSFTTLHSFTAGSGSYPNITNSDGANPVGGLLLSGNTLYGTALHGGSSGNGMVFSLSLGSVRPPPPQLSLIPSGANVVLMWPTSATGFMLQSTTNLVPPALWTSVSPGPVIVNGQNAVTNPISGTQQFYRLSQ